MAKKDEPKMAPASYSNKQVSVHITKVKCIRSGNGGNRQFLLYCVVLSGKNAGETLHVPMKAQEAETTFKAWTDLTTMPTDQHYEFPADDMPLASVVYRNNQPSYASDVKSDLGIRAKVIEDLMRADNLHVKFNTAENRKKIREFDTTAQAKVWAEKYIQEHSKPMTEQVVETPVDELTEGVGRSVITATDKSRKEFFARVNAIFKRYEFDEAEWDWRSKEAIGVGIDGSRDDYKGESIDAAVRDVTLYCMDRKPDSEAVAQDFKALMMTNGSQLSHFKAATGFANRADAYQNGKKASELYIMVEQWLENRKNQKSNEKATPSHDKQSEPPTTPQITPPQNSVPQSVPAKTDEMEVQEAIFIELPSKPQPPSQVALVPNTGIAQLPMVAQWEVMRQQADVLIKSGFLPQSVRTPEQAITIMMMGSALQIDPIVALNNINVIQGKPTVSPQLMLALVRRSGQLESFEVSDDGSTCTVKMKRKGEPVHTETFSQQDATNMGLSGKDNWKKQAPTMRKWRAIAAACRVVFSDITWGLASYTTEEINPDAAFDPAA